MIDILEAYIDLNELDNKESLMTAWAEIEHLDELELVNLARVGYILVWRMQYVRWIWTLEQFMQMWDAWLEQLDLDLVADDHMELFPVVENMQSVLGNTLWRYAPVYLAKRFELDDMFGANSLFILEKQVRYDYSQKDILSLVLEERQSNLVLI